MHEKIDLTCIVCPMGCQLEATVDKDKKELLDVTGNKCLRGKKYASEEIKSPVRMLTTTVRVLDGVENFLPIKTENPIPKHLIMKCMEVLKKVEISAPVNVGHIVCANILGTGINVVATKKIEIK